MVDGTVPFVPTVCTYIMYADVRGNNVRLGGLLGWLVKGPSE